MNLKAVIQNPFGSNKILSLSSLANSPCRLYEQDMMVIEANTLIPERKSKERLTNNKLIDKPLETNPSKKCKNRMAITETMKTKSLFCFKTNVKQNLACNANNSSVFIFYSIYQIIKNSGMVKNCIFR